MNLFLPSRKSTVETISKQLEYVTKGHVATQTILLQTENGFILQFLLALKHYNCLLNNIIVLITRSR